MDAKDRSSRQQLCSNLIVCQIIMNVSFSNEMLALKWKFKESKLHFAFAIDG